MNSTITRTVASIIAAAGVVVGVAACDPIEDSATVNGNSVQTVQPISDTTPTREMTVSQSQAIASAESYNSTLPFSRTGLIEQLEFEKFDTATATFAVDDLEARGVIDYDDNAAKAAQSYLDTIGGFSAQSLHDQLVFEGYTDEQATHGVAAVGL